MRILYRNPDNHSLCVTDVTNTKYMEDEKLLVFFGDDDICIHIDQVKSDKLTRTLYEEGKLDLTSYNCLYYEWPEDDDDEDYEDDDDEDYLVLDNSDFIFKV